MRYDADVTIHGFHLRNVALCTPVTRKWILTASKMGLLDEAWSLAALTVLEKSEQAWTSKSPPKYMSGFIGSRIRNMIEVHRRRWDHLSLDKPVGDKKRPFGTTLPIKESRHTFDPFDLVPEYRREFVRDYFYMTSGNGTKRVKGLMKFCKKHNVSKFVVNIRIADAISQLKRKYGGIDDSRRPNQEARVPRS